MLQSFLALPLQMLVFLLLHDKSNLLLGGRVCLFLCVPVNERVDARGQL